MKNKYWQEVRGCLIIFVILIHTLYLSNNEYINSFNIITRTIINFSVPCFLFLAGFFSNYKKNSSFYKKKIIRLIVPLIIWNVFYTIVANISSSNVRLKDFLLDILLSRKAGHLYYIYVLFQLYLLLPALYKISKTKYRLVPIFITLISNISFFIITLYSSLNISLYKYLIFGWISYFYLGIIMKERQNNYNITRLTIILLITIVLSATINVLLYFNISIPYELIISQFSIMNYFYSVVIIYILCFYAGIKKRTNNVIVKIGDYSYGIYLIHLLFILVLKKYLVKISNNYFINIIIIFTITLLLSFIICHFYYKIKSERRKIASE